MKNKIFQISFIIVSIVTLLLLGVYIFFSYKINSVFDEAESVVHERLSLEAKERQLSKTEDAILSTKDKRLELEKHFITSDELVSFIEYVESLDNISGGTLVIDEVDVNDEGGKPALRVSLSASGTYKQIYKLLSLIETMPYEIDIPMFDVSMSDVESSDDISATSPKWSAEIDFIVVSYLQL